MEKEIKKNCNICERLVIKLFSKTFRKFYHITRIYIANSVL